MSAISLTERANRIDACQPAPGRAAAPDRGFPEHPARGLALETQPQARLPSRTGGTNR